ncbi:MAG: Uma2 family endonuclease [Planctomycetaceae bacterium]|nr:Uma2 family endonuclease [Planctomycetaceae bacterium]
MATDLIQEHSRAAMTSPPPFEPRRLTLEEYRQIRDSGVLENGSRFEFLEGWIVTKMPQGPEHAAVVQIIQELLAKTLPAEWRVRVQSAVQAAGNEPEPDLAVVMGPAERYLDHHPAGDEIAAIIEVADTSLIKDRRKTDYYAGEGIQEYWIVNLPDRQVEVFRNPLRESAAYQDQHIALEQESLDLTISDTTLSIRVTDLLPTTK